MSPDPLSGVGERLLDQLFEEIEAWHTMLSAKGSLNDLADAAQRLLVPLLIFASTTSFLLPLQGVDGIVSTLDHAYTTSSSFRKRFYEMMVALPRERLRSALETVNRLEETRMQIATVLITILVPLERWLSRPSPDLSRTLDEVRPSDSFDPPYASVDIDQFIRSLK